MAGSPASRQGVFISYRRADTRADAGRLYDRLAARFGGSRVFMDIDDILPGQNFEAVLQETLDNCSLLLVLIGPDWTRAAGVDGSPRLQEQAELEEQAENKQDTHQLENKQEREQAGEQAGHPPAEKENKQDTHQLAGTSRTPTSWEQAAAEQAEQAGHPPMLSFVQLRGSRT